MAQLTEMSMVRLTPDERERMERLAADEDRSLAYMIRKAVQDFLARNDNNDPKE